jgi:hypothetical protein
MIELIIKIIAWGLAAGRVNHLSPKSQLLMVAPPLGRFWDALETDVHLYHAKLELGNFIIGLVLFSHVTKTGYPSKTFDVVHTDAFKPLELMPLIFEKYIELLRMKEYQTITLAAELDEMAHLITYAAESLMSSPEECVTMALEAHQLNENSL